MGPRAVGGETTLYPEVTEKNTRGDQRGQKGHKQAEGLGQILSCSFRKSGKGRMTI